MELLLACVGIVLVVVLALRWRDGWFSGRGVPDAQVAALGIGIVAVAVALAFL